MSKRFFYPALFLLISMLGTVPVWASISLDPYISNPGFELINRPLVNCGTSNGTPGLYCNGTIADWNTSSGPGAAGNAGTIQLSMGGPTGQSPAAYAQTNLLPLQGNNAAYINDAVQFINNPPYPTQWEAISQTLNNVTLQANTTYSFTYDVAQRADQAPSHFRVQVNAGSDFWILTGNTAGFTPGQWVSETLTFTTPSNFAAATPTVYLVNDGSDAGYLGTNASVAQVEFDLAPEPSELLPLALMLGFVALLGIRVRARVRKFAKQ